MIQYISIRQIMDDLLDNPLLKDLTLERCVNYAVQFIRKVGCPKVYTDKVEHLELKNFRCPLPCDFIVMNQVTDGEGYPYRYTTDTLHLDPQEWNPCRKDELTYKLQNNYLYSSQKEGEVIISYRAIELDEDGFPLLPDTGSFAEALELYIKKQKYTILFDQGKINSGVLQNVQQEYAWAVGQATSDLVTPSMDEMVSLTNIWNNLVNRVSENKNHYKHLGTREYIKQH